MSENIQIAIRKKSGKYKGAFVIDGVLQDSFNDSSLEALLDDCLNHVYVTDYPDGTSLLFTIKVDPPNESGIKG